GRRLHARPDRHPLPDRAGALRARARHPPGEDLDQRRPGARRLLRHRVGRDEVAADRGDRGSGRRRAAPRDRERRGGRRAGRGRVTLDELIDRFLARLRGEVGVSPHTYAAYAADLPRFAALVRARFGIEDVARVTRETVLAFQAAEAERGVGARSQARRLSALRGLFRFAVAERVIPDSPVSDLRQPRLPRRLPATLGASDVPKLLEAAAATPTPLRDQALLEVLYGAGVRVSEAISLRVDCIFLEERALRVLGKGDKERVVPLG